MMHGQKNIKLSIHINGLFISVMFKVRIL